MFFLIAHALQCTVILLRACLWWQKSWSVNSSRHTEALQEPETLGMMNSAGIERDGRGETEQRVFPQPINNTFVHTFIFFFCPLMSAAEQTKNKFHCQAPLLINIFWSHCSGTDAAWHFKTRYFQLAQISLFFIGANTFGHQILHSYSCLHIFKVGTT